MLRCKPEGLVHGGTTKQRWCGAWYASRPWPWHSQGIMQFLSFIENNQRSFECGSSRELIYRYHSVQSDCKDTAFSSWVVTCSSFPKLHSSWWPTSDVSALALATQTPVTSTHALCMAIKQHAWTWELCISDGSEGTWSVVNERGDGKDRAPTAGLKSRVAHDAPISGASGARDG